MKIVHCIHGLGLGGAQKVVKELVEGLDPQFFRCFVYACQDGVLREEVERAGATVRILPRRLAKLDPWWALELAQAMRRDGVELVHTHLFGDSLHGYLAARVAGGLPVLMTLHSGIRSHFRRQQLGYRWLLGRCARTVACSSAVQRSLVETRWPASETVVTIANGVEAPAGPGPAEVARLRAELGAGPDAVLFASVGRLVAQKGLDDLIRAFAALVRSGGAPARLALLGDGPCAGELRRLATAEGVGDRVAMPGFRPDVGTLLAAVDVVVFSSLCEGLPMALLEAMAAGRAIVGTAIAGIAQATRDGREALLVPPRDPPRLARAMARLARNPALRAALGSAARRRFQERFTAAEMVRRYQQLYLEVLAAWPKAA